MLSADYTAQPGRQPKLIIVDYGFAARCEAAATPRRSAVAIIRALPLVRALPLRSAGNDLTSRRKGFTSVRSKGEARTRGVAQIVSQHLPAGHSRRRTSSGKAVTEIESCFKDSLRVSCVEHKKLSICLTVVAEILRASKEDSKTCSRPFLLISVICG